MKIMTALLEYLDLFASLKGRMGRVGGQVPPSKCVNLVDARHIHGFFFKGNCPY